MVVRRSLFLVLVAALATEAAADSKFATVDMARVLREYDQVKKVAQKLQGQKDEYQEEIDKKQQEIKALNEEIQNTKDSAKKGDLEKKKKSKLIALQNQFQKLKERLGGMEKEEFDSIKTQIYSEIDKIASSKGVTMILEKQWLYYPRNTEDLTDALLQSLEGSARKGGKSAPKAPAGGESEE